MRSETRRSRHERPDDVGTLWTLRSHGRTARCALLSWQSTWEVRVVIDRETLLTGHCARTGEAFAIAEGWKQRLLQEGWQPIMPSSPLCAA